MKRKTYIDILKGIAIIFVVLTHIVPGYGVNTYSPLEAGVNSALFGIARFCVPIFFMASGALLLREDRELSIKYIYKNYVLRLLLSAFLCGFLYTAYKVKFAGYADGSYLKGAIFYIKDAACFRWGVPFAYWFVFAMTCMYISLPVIKVFTDHASEKVMRYFIVVWIIISSLQNLSGTWYFSAFDGMTNGFTFTGMFCGYAGYMIVGKYLSEHDFSKKNRLLLYFAGIICVIAIIVETYLSHRGHNVEMVDLSQYISFTVIVYALAVFTFAKYNLNVVKSVVGKALSWLGKNTLPIYLLHVLFTDYFIRDKHCYFSIHPIIDPFIWLAICLGCTLIFVFVIKGVKKIFEMI